MNANTVIAVAALVTSVVAVIVSWQEARLLRQNQEAAFLPILEVRKSFDTSESGLEIELTVRNSGQGVAIVHGGQLRVGDVPVDGYERFAADVLTPQLGASAEMSFYSLRGYYSPGEAKPVLSLNWDDVPGTRAAFERYIGAKALTAGQMLKLDVCYCSVFDRCWKTDGESVPEIVARCSLGERPIDALYESYLNATTTGREAGDER